MRNLGALELALADRKYGLFTGGFGQSQAIDTLSERAIFLLGYLFSMAALVIAVWWIIVRIFRRKKSWPPLFFLVTIVGGAYGLLLALTFKLGQYFSDTMSFALMANLGGGSLTDAMLFASNEIFIGIAALVVGMSGYTYVFRRLSSKFPVHTDDMEWAASGRLVLGLLFSTLLLAIAVPAASSDVQNGLNRTLAWGLFTAAANKITDFDRDGHGWVSSMPDHHPFDSSRYPLALDIPANGIDEDGYGGDLQLMPMAPQQPDMVISGNGKRALRYDRQTDQRQSGRSPSRSHRQIGERYRPRLQPCRLYHRVAQIVIWRSAATCDRIPLAVPRAQIQRL